jgi:hypothetical protein
MRRYRFGSWPTILFAVACLAASVIAIVLDGHR